MDQQNSHHPEVTPPRHVPTEAEIARAEAEAVAAMQRGEARADSTPDGQPPQTAPSDFVPYVDDVPEPEPAPEADEDYVPSEWERRIDALPPERWRLFQIIGGAAAGLAAIASLFVFGEELSTYGIIVAALLALVLPRYLERAWRRKLTTARRAMLIAMVAGLVVALIVTATRGGFSPVSGG